MKSQLAIQLKELLDNMSQDEFDLVWGDITERNTDSPKFSEYLQFLDDSLLNETVKYKFNEEESNFILASQVCDEIDLYSAA